MDFQAQSASFLHDGWAPEPAATRSAAKLKEENAYFALAVDNSVAILLYVARGVAGVHDQF
jgi:hypothetical protein